MAERYLDLGPGDRREVLEFAASESGRPAYLLEKDIWVVWALRTLFDAHMGAPLVFKGGTSLSKAYGAIRRFSEDVDLTGDIRALIHDLVGDSLNPLPANRSIEGTPPVLLRVVHHDVDEDGHEKGEDRGAIAHLVPVDPVVPRRFAMDDPVAKDVEPVEDEATDAARVPLLDGPAGSDAPTPGTIPPSPRTRPLRCGASRRG